MLLFLSAWILIPSPNDFLYPLAVGSPEVAPVLLAGGILLLVLSARHARHHRVARLALVFAAIASLLSLVPVAQLPIALARFNRAMAQTTAEPPARAPGAIRVTRGVPFSKADGVPLSLDVYQPAANGTFPIIMQIYGGSWQSGSPVSQEWFSRHFAERGTSWWPSITGTLPSGNGPNRSSTSARRSTGSRRKRGNSAATRAASSLVGRSAGAQLAMRLAYQEGPSSIRGVVNYYGPVDLAEGWRHPPRPDPANVRGILETFIGGTPDQKPEHYRHASPITWVSKNPRQH